MRVLHHRAAVARSAAPCASRWRKRGSSSSCRKSPRGRRGQNPPRATPPARPPCSTKTTAGAVRGAWALIEYLEETYPQAALWPRSPAARAECRRLADRFCARFDAEVSRVLLHEQVTKRLLRLGEPDSRAIRAARESPRRASGLHRCAFRAPALARRRGDELRRPRRGGRNCQWWTISAASRGRSPSRRATGMRS